MRNAVVPEDGKFTLTLFGNHHPKFFMDNHGKTLETPFLVSITVTDMMADDEFDMNDPYDVIIRLSKSSVTAEADFVAAADIVMAKEDSSMRRKQLLAQIALLASGKPGGDAIVHRLMRASDESSSLIRRLTADHFDHDLAQRHKLGGDDDMLVGQFRKIKILGGDKDDIGIISFHNLASFDAAYHDIRNWYFNEKNFELGKIEAKVEVISAILSEAGRSIPDGDAVSRMSLVELDDLSAAAIRSLHSNNWSDFDTILAA
jgi:hypothetical protein